MGRSTEGSRKPGDAATFGELRDRIKAARRRAHVELRERAAIGAERHDDRAAADALTKALGLRTLGDQWVALDAAQGYQVAYEVLWHDLAYRSSLIMDRARAEKLAREFLGHFAPDARFLTNFTSLDPTFEVLINAMFSRVMEETFNTGIVVVDRDRVGILWAGDED
jgi:hypothetical protein